MSERADTDPDDTDPAGVGGSEHFPPIRESVTLLAPDWPAPDAPVHPGTERRPFPMGFGGSGTVMMPWDQLDDVVQRGPYYGFQPHQLLDPYAEAPRTEPRGGLIFFDSGVERPDFDVMLRLLGVHRTLGEYGAFLREAENPLEQGCLSELRALSPSALARIDARAGRALIDPARSIRGEGRRVCAGRSRTGRFSPLIADGVYRPARRGFAGSRVAVVRLRMAGAAGGF